MSTRYVGTCAVCEGRVKVRDGNLVHHGYRRPGHGYIVGDCFGVGRTPHEPSSQTATAFREFLERAVEDLGTNKATIEKADELHYSYQIYVSIQEKKTVLALVKRGDAMRYEGHYRIPSFADVQRGIIDHLEYEIKNCKAGIARMSQLEASWVELPLLTWEEETIRVTEATKAERARVKAERDDKKAIKSAGRAAREARLQTKIDAAKKRARALLDAVEASDVRAVRRAYLKVLEIKLPAAVQYSFYDEHLDRTELLRSAGLIRKHNGKLMASSYEVLELLGSTPRR